MLHSHVCFICFMLLNLLGCRPNFFSVSPPKNKQKTDLLCVTFHLCISSGSAGVSVAFLKDINVSLEGFHNPKVLLLYSKIHTYIFD